MESVERSSHQRDLQIKVDLQGRSWKKSGIQVKKLNRIGDAVLDEHPLGERLPGPVL